MVVLIMALLLFGVLYKRKAEPPAPSLGEKTPLPTWTVTFKKKSTPPMTVQAESDGAAILILMRQYIDYHTIKSLERTP